MLLILKLKTKTDDKQFLLGYTPKGQEGDTSQSSEKTASDSENEEEFKDTLNYVPIQQSGNCAYKKLPGRRKRC